MGPSAVESEIGKKHGNCDKRQHIKSEKEITVENKEEVKMDVVSIKKINTFVTYNDAEQLDSAESK